MLKLALFGWINLLIILSLITNSSYQSKRLFEEDEVTELKYDEEVTIE